VANTNKSIKKDAYKLVFWQLVIIITLASVLFFVQGMRSSYSALFGGLAYVLPNFMFVWRVFENTSAQGARRFLIAFVVGEATKLFLSAILFVLIVKYLPTNVLSVLGGYVTAIFGFWVVSFVYMSHEE